MTDERRLVSPVDEACAKCGRSPDAGIHDTFENCDMLRGPCLDPASHHPYVVAERRLPVGAYLASALMAANYGGDSGEDVDRLIAELEKRGIVLVDAKSDQPRFAALPQPATEPPQHPDDGHEHRFTCIRCGVDPQPATDPEGPMTVDESTPGFNLTPQPATEPALDVIVRDCIYGLRNQPGVSREDIADILERDVAARLAAQSSAEVEPVYHVIEGLFDR